MRICFSPICDDIRHSGDYSINLNNGYNYSLFPVKGQLGRQPQKDAAGGDLKRTCNFV